MGKALDCMISAMTVSALKVGNDFKKYNDQGRSETILTSTHMGPYGFKNFPQNNVFAFLSYIILAVYRLVYNRGDIKTNKAFKTFFL